MALRIPFDPDRSKGGSRYKGYKGESKGLPPLGGGAMLLALSIWMRVDAAASPTAFNTDDPVLALLCRRGRLPRQLQSPDNAWIPLGCGHHWRRRTESDGYGYDVVGRE